MVTAKTRIIQTHMQYTPEQFFDLVKILDDRYQYELHKGNIIQMAPSSMMPSTVAQRIAIRIGIYLIDNDIGYLTGADGAYILSEEYTYAPDVGFISYATQPENIEQGFVPHAPELAVEVLSPTDSLDKAQEKARIYIAHGTRLVWLVLPTDKQVEIYQPDADPQTLDHDATLSGDPILPGFTLALDKIFIAKT